MISRDRAGSSSSRPYTSSTTVDIDVKENSRYYVYLKTLSVRQKQELNKSWIQISSHANIRRRSRRRDSLADARHRQLPVRSFPRIQNVAQAKALRGLRGRRASMRVVALAGRAGCVGVDFESRQSRRVLADRKGPDGGEMNAVEGFKFARVDPWRVRRGRKRSVIWCRRIPIQRKARG